MSGRAARRLLWLVGLGVAGSAGALLLPPVLVVPGPDESGRVLRFENRDERVRLPAGLSAASDSYSLQEGDVLFVTHLSNQWDHSEAARAGAIRVVHLARALRHHRIVHLRGPTPEPHGPAHYFIDPPAVGSADDPYLVPPGVPFPEGWSSPFERGVHSAGGGFLDPDSAERDDLEERLGPGSGRALDVPPGVTRCLVVGGWFHACLTRTVKDLVLDAIAENGETRLDVVLPSGAIFVNAPDAENARTVTLQACLAKLGDAEREAFFVERLDSIDRHLRKKTGGGIGVEFVHRRSSYRRAGTPPRPPVHLWVVDRVTE
ncbi:MAG: hypothetical protein HY720_10080 [Planctomycetes bacterium]|nr:hypothetical protein [Planctomycetota bacterium]